VNELTQVDSTFSLPASAASKINAAAVEKVNTSLAGIDAMTKSFDRNNSQSTISFMTLTMLGGHSPHRMMRQTMAEIEARKSALSESQISHAKATVKIQELQGTEDLVEQAELRNALVGLDMLESKINGSFKDIAQLISCYENIKEHNGIGDWDEEDYEAAESLHHVRRGFELMYRNLINTGRACVSTIEYMQQYGVHPQVGITEVSGYIEHVGQSINKGEILHSNHLEDFLNEMSKKYVGNVVATSERIFGKSTPCNPEYMLKLESKNDS